MCGRAGKYSLAMGAADLAQACGRAGVRAMSAGCSSSVHGGHRVESRRCPGRISRLQEGGDTVHLFLSGGN